MVDTPESRRPGQAGRCSVLLAQLNMAPALLLSMLSQGMGATLRAGAPATAVIQNRKAAP